MDWQPIETAPEWQRVLVFQNEESPTKSCKSGVFCAVRVREDWTLTTHGRHDLQNLHVLSPAPTHWMPLPKPPRDDV